MAAASGRCFSRSSLHHRQCAERVGLALFHGRVKMRKSCKADGPDDLVFQSLKDGKPIRDNNILCRFIKPAARKLGLDFVNWRCLRTSHVTWLKVAGADVKDAQAQMRHSRFEHDAGHLPAVRTRKSATSGRRTQPLSELNCGRGIVTNCDRVTRRAACK